MIKQLIRQKQLDLVMKLDMSLDLDEYYLPYQQVSIAFLNQFTELLYWEGMEEVFE